MATLMYLAERASEHFTLDPLDERCKGDAGLLYASTNGLDFAMRYRPDVITMTDIFPPDDGPSQDVAAAEALVLLENDPVDLLL